MKKFMALLLCFALILPFAPLAKAETLSLEASTESLTAKTEILSKRNTYSKTYLLADGSYQYVSYAEPIHYQDSTGAYVEINNEITSTVKLDGYAYTNTADGYQYTNTANAWNAHFSEKLNNNNAVMMTYGAYHIAFSFAEQTDTAAVMKATAMTPANAKSTLSAYHQKLSADNRAVIYKDVTENVDIAYTVQPGALKEDIILKSKQAPSAFKFRLTANGLTLRESGSTFGLFAASGEEVFTFAPLYMEDANGKRSENVSLTYTSVNNGYELTVSADADFLNAADTVYPVVIDPSIMVTGSSSTFDTCVDQQYPTSNYYLSETLWTGGKDGTNAMRTYIKFTLPNDISAAQVTSAYIYLLKKGYQDPTVKAHLVTGNWSSSSLTWNNQPTYDNSTCSNAAENTTGYWYGLKVTNIVKYWLENTYPNYGVVLKEPEEDNSAQKTTFYSSDAPSPNKPELVINYITFGSRPYQATSRTDINCMGYALEYADNITSPKLGIVDAEVYGLGTADATDYVQARFEEWMCSDNGIGAENWEPIETYNSDINENWFRVFYVITFNDEQIVNNAYDEGESLVYHWYYQTDTGAWADKGGAEIDSLYYVATTGTSPYAHWLQGTGENTKYSYGYYQIRDIRDISW